MKYPTLLPLKIHQKATHHFASKTEYEKALLKHQFELLALQQKLHRKNRKLIVLLEGPDAAGKGGVIKRITGRLDPRGTGVHSIGKPNLVERDQHYFERFFTRLPTPGMITIFDRSWYGRVLVERVEGLCSETDWKRAYCEINHVEEMLADGGIPVLKYLLDLTGDEQKRRFKERAENPLTAWKLTDEDWRNRKQWPNYHRAYRELLKRTSTSPSPWKVVSAESKWLCRTTILRDIAHQAPIRLGWKRHS